MIAENLALIHLESQYLSLLDVFLQEGSKTSCPTEIGHTRTVLLGTLNSSVRERKELGLSHQHSSTFLAEL